MDCTGRLFTFANGWQFHKRDQLGSAAQGQLATER